MNQITFIRPENFTDVVYLIPVRCKVCGKVLATKRILDGFESYIDRKNRELTIYNRLNDSSPVTFDLVDFFEEQKIYKACCRASITGKTSMQPNPYYHGVTVPRLEASIMSGHQLTLKRKHVFALTEAESDKLSNENPIVVENREELDSTLRKYTKMFRITGTFADIGAAIVPNKLIVRPVKSLQDLEDILATTPFVQVFDTEVSKKLASKTEHSFESIFKKLEDGFYEYSTQSIGEVEQLINRSGRIFVVSPDIRQFLPRNNIEVIEQSTELPRVRTGNKPVTIQLNDKSGKAVTVVRIGHNIKTGSVSQGPLPKVISTEPIKELLLDKSAIKVKNFTANEDIQQLLNQYNSQVYVLIKVLPIGPLKKAIDSFDPVYSVPIRNIAELKRVNNAIHGVYFIAPELFNKVVDPEDPFNLIQVKSLKEIPERRLRLPAAIVNKPVVIPETKPVQSMDIIVPKSSKPAPKSDMIIIMAEDKLGKKKQTEKSTLNAKAVSAQLKEFKASNPLMSGFSQARQVIIPRPEDLGENFSNRRYGLPKYVAMPNVAGPYSYNTSTFTPASQQIVVNSAIDNEFILAEMARNKQFDIRPPQ